MPSKKRRANETKVVYRTAELQLVEFTDGPRRRRAWLPSAVAPTLSECRGGIPAGIAADTLAPLIQGEAERIAANLENALHTRGLYAAADAESLPEAGRVVEAALAEAVRPLAALVLEIIRQEV